MSNRALAMMSRNSDSQTLRWTCVALVVTFVGVWGRPFWLASPRQRSLFQAAARLATEDYAQAERLALRVLAEQPQCPLALLIAGTTAARRQDNDAALRFFSQVKDDGGEYAVEAQFRTAQRLLILGRVGEAERRLRRVLECDPRHIGANRRLVTLLEIEGRSWEARPFLRQLILEDAFGRGELLLLGAVDSTLVEDPRLVELSQQSVPDDPLILLGRARLALSRNKYLESEPLLRHIAAVYQQLPEAQARWGRLLWETGDDAAFSAWCRTLDGRCLDHPETWYLRGLWAKRQQQPAASVRCFLEVLQRDANHVGACFQLAQSLRKTNLNAQAEAFGDYAKRLSQADYLLGELNNLNDFDLMRRAVDQLVSLGRIWEAAGWCHVATRLNPDQHWATQKLRSLYSRVISLSSSSLTP